MRIVTDATARLDDLDDTPSPSRWQSHAPAALLVLGTLHSEWRIGHISTDVIDLLGYLPEALLGRSALELVHPKDAATLAEVAVRSRESPGGSDGTARFAAVNGQWLRCWVLLQPLAGRDHGGLAFALSRASGDRFSDKLRVRELEERLRRIAQEVSASGVVSLATTLPTSAEVPALDQLTTREYEIVVRLSSGERVATIARGLFLSESTVRNHLTSVYRKLGVRSQIELMTWLRSREAAASNAKVPKV